MVRCLVLDLSLVFLAISDAIYTSTACIYSWLASFPRLDSTQPQHKRYIEEYPARAAYISFITIWILTLFHSSLQRPGFPNTPTHHRLRYA